MIARLLGARVVRCQARGLLGCLGVLGAEGTPTPRGHWGRVAEKRPAIAQPG